MNYKQFERLKALAFELSALSANLIAEFMAIDRQNAENEKEQKKVPKTAFCCFQGANSIAK